MQQTASNYKPKHLSLPVRTALMLALLVAALLLVPALVAHAADFTVDSVSDIGDNNPGDGSCNAGANVCTLRAAIEEANALAGPDTISFSLPPASTITLNNGELQISSALTISGPGASDLTVSGNNNSRVISSTGNVTITGVTIADGNVTGFGGGVYNAGQLVLSDCVVTNNTVGGISGGTLRLYGGGGIFNTDGDLTINRCTVSNNTIQPEADDGGGILTFTGTLTINNSYVYSNTAADDGGGIRANFVTTVFINNTTIKGNTAGGDGGGFRTYRPESVTYIVNSTISGNSAENGPGGGVFIRNSTATITNTTIVDNAARTGAGGLHNDIFTPSTVHLANSIVAGNETFTTTVGGPDLGGTITSGDYNLLQVVSGATLTGTVANTITGTAPLLGPLADNGGDTPTHALLTGSPAIDQIPSGVNGCGTTINTDQRGVSRPQGAACDIGAVEAYAALAVTKSADDVSPDPGQLVVFVITVENTDILPITNVVVSDSLPAGLTFAGPVTIDGATGTVANDAGDLPVLASGFGVNGGERVTITFPVTVNTGLAGATSITNVAAVTSSEISTPHSDAETLVVNEVAPTAVDDSDTVLEDGSITIDVLANDEDLNGDTLTLIAVGTPDNGGTATIVAGEIQYAPAANFNGTETFTYTVSDGVATDTALVTIQVTPVNDAPSFTPGTNQFVTENAGPQSVTNWATNISPGAANESGQTLTFAVTNNNSVLFSVQPAVNAADGTLTFTPAPDTTGMAVVTVVLEDDGGVANGGKDTSDPVTFDIWVLQEGTTVVELTKTAVGPGGNTVDLELGDIVTYTITLENMVATVANGVMMTDVLPAGVTFGEWLEQGSAMLPEGGNTVQWGPHEIPGNASFSISFTVVLTTEQSFAGQSIVNTAVFTSDNADTGSDDAVVTIAGGHRIFLPVVFRASP